jgi:hypothetical protein
MRNLDLSAFSAELCGLRVQTHGYYVGIALLLTMRSIT